MEILDDSTVVPLGVAVESCEPIEEERDFNDIRVLMDYNVDHAEVEFFRALDTFYTDCCEYQNYVQTLPELPKLNKLDQERSRLCEREIIPGKRTEDEKLSRIQGQVTASFWLGLNDERCDLLEGVPRGYDQTNDVINISETHVTPPYQIEYIEKYQFELRCHLYQAKCLLALDESGLSDCFCRIAFNGIVVNSQVIPQSLNPTWDETLVLSNVTLYGTAGHLHNYPPTIVVEIMDQDIRDEDFMGHVVINPMVKLVSDPYEKPELHWYPVHRGAEHGGELLAAFELLQLEMGIQNWVLPDDVPALPEPKKREGSAWVIPVPDEIRPSLELFRLEVLFWSLRDLQRINLMAVEKPRVDVECGGYVIQSDVISRYSKSPKFKNMVKTIDVMLPTNPVYWPAVTIRCIDFRSFGRGTLVGSTVIRKLDTFLIQPEDLTKDPNALPLHLDMPKTPLGVADGTVGIQIEPAMSTSGQTAGQTAPTQHQGFQEVNLSPVSPAAKSIRSAAPTIIQSKADKGLKKEEQDEIDWWTKYFSSLNAMLEEERKSQMKNVRKRKRSKRQKKRQKGIEMATKAFDFIKSKAFKAHEELPFVYYAKKEDKPVVTHMKIFPTELEQVDDFQGFSDWIKTYTLFRGVKTGAYEEQKVAGKFKGYIKICKQPLPESVRHLGLFTSVPSNDPVNVLVRVYAVRANDLRPTDVNRKSDPYLYLKLGHTKINDKENYIPNQLNPIFGKCFEINTVFPFDSQLCIQIYDKDILNKDNLIGETHVDLENRFYSIHRGTCGLAQRYNIVGYNAWRDSQKPTGILSRLCAQYKLIGPTYNHGQVQVGRKIFIPPIDIFSDGPDGKHAFDELASYALGHWEEVPGVGVPLVPEHIEMRSLYHPERPGIIQGKLEMWVDLFTMDSIPKPPVEITPRQPNKYELRVTILNTDDVVLEEMNYITGEQMSDIYVKGYLVGPDEDEQNTDIHYRSLTGEGNFNWRFVFPFEYLEPEEKIVIKKKATIFSLNEEELKVSPVLTLQVWDADIISKDDFLGSLQLNLQRMSRGTKSAKMCSIDLLDADSDMPTINLFKQRRTKGWWPFIAYDEFGEAMLVGKVEAEFQLVTGDDAEKQPVGLGRSEPCPLPFPKRPDTSFTLFMNPLKSARYFVGYYKWTICKIVAIICVILFFALFLYSLPGYLVKKLLNA